MSTAKRRRGYETVLDMVRSMGLVALAVAAVVLVTWRPTPDGGAKPVDLSAIAAGAEDRVGFPLLVPDLPTDWVPTSARLEPATDDITHHTWHIGWVSPDGAYFGLEQSDTLLVETYQSVWVGDWPGSPVEVGGVEWQVHLSPTGDQMVYVHRGEGWLVALLGQNSPEGMALVTAVSGLIAP